MALKSGISGSILIGRGSSNGPDFAAQLSPAELALMHWIVYV